MEEKDLDLDKTLERLNETVTTQVSESKSKVASSTINDFYNTFSTDDLHVSKSGYITMGTITPNSTLHTNGNNSINGLGHGNNSTTYYNQGGADTYSLIKERRQLEDVKNALNSVQNVLEELKDQVRSLTSSIEAENELKHERRKLGGDE